MSGDMKLWTFYVTVVLVGAKIAAFAIQYGAFRFLVGSRIRAAARAEYRNTTERFQAKWVPVRVKKTRKKARGLGLRGGIGYTAAQVQRYPEPFRFAGT